MSEKQKGVAIIGMAGRFPGAKDLDSFWQNLRDGVESISYFTDEELIASGVDPSLLQDPNYVKAGFVLEDIERFDAQFFDYSPREAEILDPQQRIFLECAWSALENAGYDPKNPNNLTGVYAGASMSDYLLRNLLSHQQLVKSLGWQIAMANEQEFLPTRVSYKMNLKGPSLSVGTACSTSLVAVHLAYRALLGYECDMALAGGATVQLAHQEGYLYQPGGILSRDGKTRAFDASGEGGPYGNGVGVLVLKRLTDAVADRDRIYAVIKGSAINNDGAAKVSYSAPSVTGQAEAIAMAQAIADFEPETIGYVETHGSGTALGDPIEIRALEKVFRAGTEKQGFCAIGSVKTNVSHLDTAAGVAGLIKATLALDNREIPPSLHFDRPNPEIDFASSPFYVNTQLSQWESNGAPRRAGVSSFGIGGTNAHVVLEEAPMQPRELKASKSQLLVLSAKTSTALDAATANLIAYLEKNPDLSLSDVAYTLQVGRHGFSHRRVVVCQDVVDAITALQDPKRVLTGVEEATERPIAFMFTGLGTQYVNMGRELYNSEPAFQTEVDRCCTFLEPLLGIDLKQAIYPAKNESSSQEKPQGLDLRQMLGRSLEPPDAASERLNQTHLAHPAIFVIEYALAKLWQSWGIEPVAAIGYSIGEYVAATIAGVLSVEDALTLVARRAQLIQKLPAGAMLAVSLTEAEARSWLDGRELAIAANESPSACVVAGEIPVIEELQRDLMAKGIVCRRLPTSHAFHSPMMEAIASEFTAIVRSIPLNSPQIPYISNVTGTWITEAQATPEYWMQHTCQTVRFSQGLQELDRRFEPILIEVGCGQSLSSSAMQYLPERPIFPSLPHAYERRSDRDFWLESLGRLWLSGVRVNWDNSRQCYRIPLPTYPFERQKYWLEPQLETVRNKREPQADIWESIVAAGQSQAEKGLEGFDELVYQEKRESLDRLCLVYLNRAFRNLGTFNQLGDRYTAEEICQQFGVIHRYRELVARWLLLLFDAGCLQQENGRFSHLVPLSDDLPQLVKRVKNLWQDTLQQIELLELYGDNIPAILKGDREALELHVSTLISEGELNVEELPSNIYYGAILRECLRAAIASFPKRLRILEIGAGSGTATAEILPILPTERTEYTFTDVGGFFLNAAKKRFSDYPFIEYKLLDIDVPFAEQGYEQNSIDVIVAFKALHVARNMKQTLDRVRSLLVPGGYLILWDTTETSLETELIDGLIMKPIEDESGQRNMGNPFLSVAEWEAYLKDSGFANVAAFSKFSAFREHVIVAQAGGEKYRVSETSNTHSRPNLNNAYIAPTNALETLIADIFQELLGIEKVGIHDSFFTLGGDSLTGTVLVSKLRKCFEIDLPVRALFEAPTVAELALIIEEILIAEIEALPESEVDSELVKQSVS